MGHKRTHTLIDKSRLMPVLWSVTSSPQTFSLLLIFYITLHYITLYYNTLHYILFYSILFYSILFYSILFYSILFYYIILYVPLISEHFAIINEECFVCWLLLPFRESNVRVNSSREQQAPPHPHPPPEQNPGQTHGI